MLGVDVGSMLGAGVQTKLGAGVQIILGAVVGPERWQVNARSKRRPIQSQSGTSLAWLE